MSNTRELIDAIISGSAVETEEAFNAAMAERISTRLDSMRMEVAAGMFRTEEAEQIEESTSSFSKDADSHMPSGMKHSEHKVSHKDIRGGGHSSDDREYHQYHRTLAGEHLADAKKAHKAGNQADYHAAMHTYHSLHSALNADAKKTPNVEGHKAHRHAADSHEAAYEKLKGKKIEEGRAMDYKMSRSSIAGDRGNSRGGAITVPQKDREEIARILGSKDEKKVKEEVELDERNKENAMMRKSMDASRGARYKAAGNIVPDKEPEHKTNQAHNKAIGRALRQ